MSQERKLGFLELDAIDPRFRPYGDSFDEAAFFKRYPDIIVRRGPGPNDIAFMADLALVRLVQVNPYLLHQPAEQQIEGFEPVVQQPEQDRIAPVAPLEQPRISAGLLPDGAPISIAL